MTQLLSQSRWLPWAVLAVATLGFVDATYLSAKHYTHTAIPCSITHGCEIVTTSAYSEIAGISVALLGAIYYFVIIAGTFIAIDKHNEKLFRAVTGMTILGLGASLWFVSAQLFIIRAICQWCMVSALTSTTLFVLGWIVAPRMRKKHASAHQTLPTENIG